MKKIRQYSFGSVMFTSALAFSLNGVALDLSGVEMGDVIAVEMSRLHPTQPSVGYDQVYYKLGRYKRDVEKKFDEICENNGAAGVERFSTRSNIRDPDSFTCKEPIGSRKNEMKTVVIAPGDKLYLTDGHHTFNVYWHMDGGGADFTNHVVVAGDYRDYESHEAFWERMKADGNVWLFDLEGEAITPDDLPVSLGMENFGNDKYRSLMYFTRGVAWQKPERMTNPDTGERYEPIPFLEFYWSKEVRDRVDIRKFDLDSLKGYNQAIIEVSNIILDMDLDDVGGSGRSVKSMGQFSSINRQEIDRLNRPGRGKLSHMIWYKGRL